jgi:hypothetical protein
MGSSDRRRKHPLPGPTAGLRDRPTPTARPIVSSRTAISEAECRQLRAAYSEGRSVGEIAADYDYARSAIRRHVHDYCSHAVPDGEWGTSAGMDCPLCGASIRHLPDHLPHCPEAGEL